MTPKPAPFPGQVLRMFTQQYALLAAIDFDLATLIGDGQKTIDELAEISGAKPGWIARVLRVLAEDGKFRECTPGVFCNTESSHFFRSDLEGSLYWAIRFWGSPYILEVMGHIKDVMRKGGAASDVLNKEPFYEYLAHNSEESAIFENAIALPADRSNDDLASAYSFHGTVVDVGGGKGNLLWEIMGRHPVNGILFDQPGVIKQVREENIHPGMELEDGNFFQRVPAGDIYLLRDILHCFDDVACLQLCTRLHEAMHDQAVLLIAEQLLEPEAKMVHAIDLLMGALYGGAQRSEKGWIELLLRGNFVHLQTIRTHSYALLVFQKA